MARRRRRPVAMPVCAAVALLLPAVTAALTGQAEAQTAAAATGAWTGSTMSTPAVAASGTGDVVAAEAGAWRGWVAYEQETKWGDGYDYQRMWWAEPGMPITERPPLYGNGTYGFDLHGLHTYPPPADPDCRTQILEFDATLDGGAVDSSFIRTSDLSQYLPEGAFQAGTPGVAFHASAFDPTSIVVDGAINDFCGPDGGPSPYDGRQQHPGGRTTWAGVALPEGAPLPVTISERRSYVDNSGSLPADVTYQICMTRSTADTDDDGLPDAVDIEPSVRGGLKFLGSASKVPGTQIERTLAIIPDGIRDVPSCPATDQHEKQVMVSLGDSYSSGEGVYGYDPGTDDPGVNHCHRANSAYARVAFRAMTAAGADLDEIHSLACSGAVAENVLDTPFCGSGCDASGREEPPQLARLRELDRRPDVSVDVVTLGIGGNDAGFGAVIAACMTPGGGNCVADLDPYAGGTGPKKGAPVLEVIERIERVLGEVVVAAPEAEVVLVGYPVFISGKYDTCPAFLGGGIGADEAEWIRGQILYMNVLLEDLAAKYRQMDVRFLSLDNAYGDNVLCNGGPEDAQWVHGLVKESHKVWEDDHCIPNKTLPVPVLIGGKPFYHGDAVSICNESFHPKAEGHAASGQALAYCLVSDECGAASTETVRSPAELVEGPSIDERECVIYGNPCVTPGKSMKVGGKGFKPGSKVSVELHSRPVVLGEATADASGVVEAIVTLQAGTVPPGQHELVLVGPGDDTIVRVGRTPVEVICASGFSDIAADDPFCGDITWMRSTGVTTGYSDGTYRPALGLSRAQMASFLWRLAGQPVVAASAPSFADVLADNPHATAVRWLAARGITTGYPDGTFKADLGLTRAHMAAFLHRFADQPAPSASAPTFADVPADNQFATAISWLAGEGITLGKSDGTYGPADALNRQQMAAFLHRFGEPRGLPE